MQIGRGEIVRLLSRSDFCHIDIEAGYAKASVVAQKHIQKNMLVLDIGGLSIVQM